MDYFYLIVNYLLWYFLYNSTLSYLFAKLDRILKKNFINPKGNSCAFYMLSAIKIEIEAETETTGAASHRQDYQSLQPNLAVEKYWKQLK